MPGLVGGFGNYFLPIHCGAPDYFKYLNKIYKNFFSVCNINYYTELNLFLDNKHFEKNILGSYLAGLFEGDGHII